MLHLYALAHRPAQLAPIEGIDGSRLQVSAASSAVDSVVSVVSTPEGQPSEAAILEHAAVVEHLAAVNDALLPARYGRGYPDEATLADAIAERESQVQAALERVRGCVEIGLRVFTDDPEVTRAGESTGREYMVSRLREVRSADRLAGDLHDSLAAAAKESFSRVLASPQLLLSATYLLPRPELGPFRTALAVAEREHPELTFVCTGPWPPYSFAMIDGDRR
jgi:hypothetical protein